MNLRPGGGGGAGFQFARLSRRQSLVGGKETPGPSLVMIYVVLIITMQPKMAVFDWSTSSSWENPSNGDLV